MATSIKIDDALKARVQQLASQRRRSAPLARQLLHTGFQRVIDLDRVAMPQTPISRGSTSG